MRETQTAWSRAIFQRLEDSKIEVVSIDFFDTLAVRILDEASLIALAFDLFRRPHEVSLATPVFLHAWNHSLSSLSLQHKGPHFSYSDISLATFKHLSDSGYIFPRTTSSLADAFCKTLVRLEADNLHLSAELQNFLSTLSEQRCILISDTYYPQQALQQFLKTLGIDDRFDGIFSSAELGCSKYSGDLYKAVLAHYDIAAESVLHIGDNPFSDVQQARHYGITPVQFTFDRSALCGFTEPRSEALCLDYFACSVLSPLVLRYCAYLQQVLSDGVFDGAVFMGRDAYLLYAVCSRNKQINTPMHYGPLNRVCMNQLCFHSLDANLLGHLYSHYPQEGVSALIGAMGMADTDFANRLSTLFEGNLKRELSVEIRRTLLEDEALVRLFQTDLQDRRDSLIGYLEHNLGVSKSTRVAFIDLGWRGSMAAGLAGVSAPGSQLILLANLSPQSHGSTIDSFRVEALVSCQTPYATWCDLLSEYRELLEYVCSEPQGSCRYIDQGRPVFSEYKTDSIQKQRIQQAVLKQSDNQSVWDDTEKVLENFRHFVKNPPEPFVDAMKRLEVDHSIDGQSRMAISNLLIKNNNMAVPETSALAAKQARVYTLLAFFSELEAYSQLYIYGAGSGCRLLIPFLKSKVIGILDVNADKVSSDIEGIPVFPPTHYTDTEVPVVVSIIGRREQVGAALNAKPGRLYFLDDYL